MAVWYFFRLFTAGGCGGSGRGGTVEPNGMTVVWLLLLLSLPLLVLVLHSCPLLGNLYCFLRFVVMVALAAAE